MPPAAAAAVAGAQIEMQPLHPAQPACRLLPDPLRWDTLQWKTHLRPEIQSHGEQNSMTCTVLLARPLPWFVALDYHQHHAGIKSATAPGCAVTSAARLSVAACMQHTDWQWFISARSRMRGAWEIMGCTTLPSHVLSACRCSTHGTDCHCHLPRVLQGCRGAWESKGCTPGASPHAL